MADNFLDPVDQKNKNSIISRMALNDNKAGMHGLDKEKINKVIMENTLGSRYYKNEQKRDAQVQDRILKMKTCLEQYTALDKAAALQKADAIIEDIEKERKLNRTIIHIDMDAFYAAVEERDQPHLKSKPMAVGGMSMLSTSNYVARKYGVRAGMPGFIALKLCPELILVGLNFSKYKMVSQEVQAILIDYDENFVAPSSDEAFLDITDHLQSRILMAQEERTFKYNPELVDPDHNPSSTSRTFGFSAGDVAEEIRFRIHQKTKLTASAGIAPNTMLAKIGSDLNKPNGQTLIPFEKEAIVNFMKDLPLRKVSGIGKVSEQLLKAFDINTCGDMLTKRDLIILLFSSVSCSFFLRAGLGCSSNRVFQDEERKSISTERTFNAISSEVELFSILEKLCVVLSKDVEKQEVEGKTVTLKTKTVDFEVHTKSKSVERLVSKSDEIFEIARELLKQELEQTSNKLVLRLMGVGLSKLESPSSNKQSSIKRFFSKPESMQEVTIANVTKLKDEIPNSCIVNEDANKLETPSKPSTSNDIQKQEISNDKKTIVKVSESQQSFVCPSCSNCTFSELSALNVHLDQCLAENSKESEDQRSKNSSSITDLTCPICSVVFDSRKIDLQYFNSHVDSCLNRQAIKDIIKSDCSTYSNNKKSAMKSPSKPAKRRKIIPKQTNTIKSFFS